MMFLCSLLLSTATLRAKAPEGSLQKQMEWLHATHHVDFVYDAAIDVKQPYHGPTLRGLTLEKRWRRSSRAPASAGAAKDATSS